MNKFYPCFLITVLNINNNLIGQIKAITDTGDEVILHEDKTWRYKIEKTKIDSNKIQKTPNNINTTHLFKSDVGDYGVYINTNIVKTNKTKLNKDAEFSFSSINGKFWAIFMSENIGIPLKSVKEFKINTMKEKMDSFEILQEEEKNINGINIIHCRFKGTANNLNFIYCVYFASCDSSTSQLFAYCLENDFENNRNDIYKLLNGFVKIK